MATYYDTELENQKKTKSLNIALPLLAALEAVGSSIASKGQNVTSNTLGLYKDVQSQRQAALDRALGRDKATADSARQDKLLGFQEAKEGREKSEYERQSATRAEEQKRMADATRRLLGSRAEVDPTTGAEIKPAVPGVEGLTDIDRAAIQLDPVGWLTNKLKPQSMNFFMSEGGLVQVPKVGGQAQTVTTPDGRTVKAPPRPAPTMKTPEQIAAEAAARVAGTAAGERAEAAKTKISGLEVQPGATITNDAIKKVQEIAVRKDELVNSINRLQGLYKKHGTEVYGEAAREMESLVKGIQLTAKEFYNLGVLNGPDLGLMESMIANPTTLRSKAISLVPGAGDPVTPKLNEAKSLIDNRFKSTIKSLGFQEAKAAPPGGGGSGKSPARGGPDRKALARQALNDPEATQEEKEQAKRILAGP